LAILPKEPVLTSESLILATSRSRACWVVGWSQRLPAVAYEKEKVQMLRKDNEERDTVISPFYLTALTMV
jgi:hypothetical protein